MPVTSRSPAGCSLYLVTPPLAAADANAFAEQFAEVLDAAAIACALVRFAPVTQAADAKAIVAPILRAAIAADCALLIENDGRLAARLGADGVHVSGAGAELAAAVESLKPERIVGAGFLPTRDDAMTAGEMGADYVMFGEPRRGASASDVKALAERVAWWAEIFETPCVAYAETVAAVAALADAGADFVALGDAVWASPSPFEAARAAEAALAGVGSDVP
jgi:thiamine-phosphate pyrophosphorylase